MSDIIECPNCGNSFGGWEGTCPYCEGLDWEGWKERAEEAETRVDKLVAWLTDDGPLEFEDATAEMIERNIEAKLRELGLVEK